MLKNWVKINNLFEIEIKYTEIKNLEIFSNARTHIYN